MMDVWVRGLLVGLCVTVLFPCLEAAQAASFDCTTAHSKVEKLICSDPVTSKLDSDLGVAYDRALAKADAEQRKKLQIKEKRWLRNVRNTCTDQACVKLAYWDRLAQFGVFRMSKAEQDKLCAGDFSSIYACSEYQNTAIEFKLKQREKQVIENIASKPADKKNFQRVVQRWSGFVKAICGYDTAGMAGWFGGMNENGCYTQLDQYFYVALGRYLNCYTTNGNCAYPIMLSMKMFPDYTPQYVPQN